MIVMSQRQTGFSKSFAAPYNGQKMEMAGGMGNMPPEDWWTAFICAIMALSLASLVAIIRYALTQ